MVCETTAGILAWRCFTTLELNKWPILILNDAE